MRPLVVSVVALLVLLLAPACMEEKSPPRDQIPVLKGQLQRLEQALVDHNQAGVDSLMSVDILDYNLSSDSLINLVYGANGDWTFQRLGNYEIIYDRDMSLITCDAIDSADQVTRPLRLYLKPDNDTWLFTKFEVNPEAGVPEAPDDSH